MERNEIVKFLAKWFVGEVEVDKNEVQLFMNRFDKKNKRKVKYSEFCSAFAPHNKRLQNTLVQRTPVNTQLEMTYDQVFTALTQVTY